MDLLVIRHAIAELRSPGVLDAERALTPEGRERFADMCAMLREMGVYPTVALHSPWRRAKETAEALVESAGRELPCFASPALARDPDHVLLGELKELAKGRPNAVVAVVGHEPWLGDLTAWLCVGDEDCGAAFRFKKGGVAHLRGDLEPGQMQLRGLWAPKLASSARARLR